MVAIVRLAVLGVCISGLHLENVAGGGGGGGAKVWF